MKKRIVWSVILVPFLVIGLIFTVGCEEQEPAPKMTAPEVCQYVNQALPDDYVYLGSAIRSERHFTAQEAVYVEDTWLVTVKIEFEPQQLKEGQWVFDAHRVAHSVLIIYSFDENTAALKIKEVATP